jgi:hypothetical protein
VFAALIWLGWPSLLPLGGGSDLAHHLQLVDYIERHCRLPGASTEPLLGGMVSYTPGAHLLASILGRWARRDGLHAMYPILAASAALKAAIVFLIARRLMPDDRLRTPAAVAAALLLFLPFDYFVGPFVRASFFAQALSANAAAVFASAGVGAFLTWPVWIGPPVLALLMTCWRHRESPSWRTAPLALVPIAAVAAVHMFGRVESAAIVQAGGSTFLPTMARFSWPFVSLAVIGSMLVIRERRVRTTWLLLGAIALQAIALFVLAVQHGSESPYMALKMVNYAVYPMSVFAAMAIAGACGLLARFASDTRVAYACWAIVLLLAAGVVRTIASGPPQTPAITEDLSRAGTWARTHVPAACVEYLVPQPHAAYWLHHAVLANPSYPPAGAPVRAFEYRDAVVRWITRTSFPYAIADLRVVPREAREEMDELARFGDVIVGVRRGQTECR